VRSFFAGVQALGTCRRDKAHAGPKAKDSLEDTAPGKRRSREPTRGSSNRSKAGSIRLKGEAGTPCRRGFLRACRGALDACSLRATRSPLGPRSPRRMLPDPAESDADRQILRAGAKLSLNCALGGARPIREEASATTRHVNVARGVDRGSVMNGTREHRAIVSKPSLPRWDLFALTHARRPVNALLRNKVVGALASPRTIDDYSSTALGPYTMFAPVLSDSSARPPTRHPST
jgi:hypothetical protein